MNEIAKGVKEAISISWPVITLTVVILIVLRVGHIIKYKEIIYKILRIII